MSFPPFLPTVNCSLSRPIAIDGDQGDITSAFLSADRDLVWAASGDTMYAAPAPLPVLEDGTLFFPVVPVDVQGVFDLAGNMVQFWAYRLRVLINLPGNVSHSATYCFQPLLAEGDVDLDLHPQEGAVSYPPATVSGQEVTVITGTIDYIDGGVP